MGKLQMIFNIDKDFVKINGIFILRKNFRGKNMDKLTVYTEAKLQKLGRSNGSHLR